MDNKRRIPALLLLCALTAAALCACGGPAPEETQPPPESAPPAIEDEAGEEDEDEKDAVDPDSIIGQMESLYRQLDDSRLPLESYTYWHSTDQAELDELPQQLVLDTPEAYFYAQTIRNYLCYGNILEDFEGVESLKNDSVILQTALFHTKPIQWHSWAEEGREQTHQISWLMRNENAESRGLCELFYADDVQDTIRRMFGEGTHVMNWSTGSYLYYPREGIYGCIGSFGGPWWRYPMLLAMEPTEDGMICEVVLVWALDKETPFQLPGFDEITAENFAEATADLPRYRYTFAMGEDGAPILTALQTLESE